MLAFIFFQCKRPPPLPTLPPPTPPSPPPSGAIKFGDTAEECTQDIAGTVRYSTSKNALELCDGSSWSQLATVPDLGQTPERPGVHCLDILDSGEFLRIVYHGQEHQSKCP